MNNQPPGFWKGQSLHFSALAILLILVAWAWTALGPWNPFWFWGSIAVPVLHQIYVWITWRLELKNQAISRSLGFNGYLVIFMSLFLSRPVFVYGLARVDQGSLGLPDTLATILMVILLIPPILTGYSVRKYFGVKRASGGDHFMESYREMPLVKKGMFRYSANAMYTFAFLLFWAIAIGFNSIGALVASAFAHLYIWAHYLATEKPDMKYLYGKAQARSEIHSS